MGIGRDFLWRTVESNNNLTSAKKALPAASMAVDSALLTVAAAQDDTRMLQHNLLRLIRVHIHEIRDEESDPDSDAETYLNRPTEEEYHVGSKR